MRANVFTCPELIEATYENIANQTHLNAYVNVRPQEEALREAEESQKRIEKSKCVIINAVTVWLKLRSNNCYLV